MIENSNSVDEIIRTVKQYTWSSLYEIGPEKKYSAFNQIVTYFSKLGYFIFVKLTNDGWTAKRMPVLPERGTEQGES